MPIKEIIGQVISHKMDKTVTVAAKNQIAHKKYNKILSKTKKYHAHDESNEYLTGDTVRIQQTKPISKTKCWRVIEKLS